MFDVALFWASISGGLGILFLVLAFITIVVGFAEDEPLLATLGGGVLAILGVTGIAFSLALTGGWS